MSHPPVCNYEGSDYQSSFWEQGARDYEDRVEAVALRRLLPKGGDRLLEIGAGAGRNSGRYPDFSHIFLLDYSRSQLEQAQGRLGRGGKYVFVAADAYRLPFVAGAFDATTVIRTLHHMVDVPRALGQVYDVLRAEGIFILEFANKRNLKSILRYWSHRQTWSPFAPEPVEFATLNFDFHPTTIFRTLSGLGFGIERKLAVSSFRITFFKKTVPTPILVFIDSLFQWTGALWQLAPSIFVRAKKLKTPTSQILDPVAARYSADSLNVFKCPECGHSPLSDQTDHLLCTNCKRNWSFRDGIYDFREPV